eukprot:GDKI01037650.1.p1 GENE.GDKI01037650.1~~GDKI01037650.1.p1  ORF type:complete len:381 (-),score=80.12 GDKI01037650.1:258-1400(-)
MQRFVRCPRYFRRTSCICVSSFRSAASTVCERKTYRVFGAGAALLPFGAVFFSSTVFCEGENESCPVRLPCRPKDSMFVSDFPVIAAVVTPFNEETGELNTGVIPKYIEHLERQRCDGVFVSGTAGEGPCCTVTERKQLMEAWKNHLTAANSRLRLIVHVGCAALEDARELAEHAWSIGVDGIAAVPPFYIKPHTPHALAESMKYIADGAPSLPFFYYHFPAMTGVHIPAAVVVPLLRDRIPTFRGIKYTDRNITDFASVSTQPGANELLLMGGFDDMARVMLKYGANGWIGGCVGVIGDHIKRMIEADRACDIETAQSESEFIYKLTDLFDMLGLIPGLRAAHHAVGVEVGRHPRLPSLGLDKEQVTDVRQWMHDVGLL